MKIKSTLGIFKIAPAKLLHIVDSKNKYVVGY